jgi:hypothetical protein
MGACFVWVSHARQTPSYPLENLDAWAPFVPEDTHRWTHRNNSVSVRGWSTHAESSRGGYFVSTTKRDLALGFTGWVREPEEAPLTLSVSQVLLHLCLQEEEVYEHRWRPHVEEGREISTDRLSALHRRAGQFALACADRKGRLHALSDAFAGQHLYYGCAEGEVIVSTRASLVAAYLNRGAPPRPRSQSLAWQLGRHESPLGDAHSAWEGVHLLMPEHRLEADRGALVVHRVDLMVRSERSWDDLYQDLIWRAGQLKRIPQVKFELPLTGGLDSRLILGALINAEALSSVDRFYLNASYDHADTRAAQGVATRYQLPLEVCTPQEESETAESFFDRLRRHMFHVEHMVNAWDLKVTSPDLSLPHRGVLPGHYGELYRSHALPVISRSGALFQSVYRTKIYMNRHKLLSTSALKGCRAFGVEWLKERRQAGVPSDHLLDELHREARMWRWVSQTQMFESLGHPSINLLPDVELRAKYATLSLRARLDPTVHFELLRRVDRQLWRLPFADHQWPSSFFKGARCIHTDSPIQERPALRVEGGGNELSYQMRMWDRQGAEIGTFLRAQGAEFDDFYALIDRGALLKKVKNTLKNPHAQAVKGLLQATAIKVALSESLSPYPLKR